jgi:hypothetical protein
MQKSFFVIILGIIIVGSSITTYGFIPWLTDDNAMLLVPVKGNMICKDGSVYTLTDTLPIIYNQANPDMAENYFRLGASGPTNTFITGVVTAGEVKGKSFQIEGFILSGGCSNFNPYAFELEGLCNLTADTEVLYDISGPGVDFTFSSVKTACTNISKTK